MTNMIGQLRYRVVLQAPQRTEEDGGAATITWRDVAGIFAQIFPVTGREIVTADGTQGRVTHEVVIRAGVGAEPQMRIVEGTRVLHIHAVLDIDGRRRWLKCLCEERLP